jgi:glycosyltransferase involved in cell wall biosynthesis
MFEEFLQNGVRADRLHLIRLPLLGTEPQAQPPQSRAVGTRLLMVSRLTDVKGGRNLIAAVPQAQQLLGRRLSLTIAGTGPELEALQRTAIAGGVDVRFVGWSDAPRRNDLMRAADLLVIPSVWPEPFGLVGIEAGSVGLPAVGYAVGGVPDWLVPGESGELAPGNPPTVRGLAEAIARALGRTPEEFAKLRNGAWKIARRHTMKVHVEALHRILGRVARAAPPGASESLPCAETAQ